MNKRFHKMTLLSLAVILLLTACGPSEEDQNATAAAQTLEANAIQETALMDAVLKVTQTVLAQPPTEMPVPPPAQPTDTLEVIQTQALGTLEVAPTLPIPPTSTLQVPAGNYIAALAGETIPDGTIMSPGQEFTKTWKLRNMGTSTWSTDFSLVFIDGRRMTTQNEVYLPVPVAPGTLVDISVPMVAPSIIGTYQGFWKLQDPNGQKFGVGEDGSGSIWVKIIVTATPTS